MSRRSETAWLAGIVAAAGSFFFFAPPASAQILTLGRWEGSLEGLTEFTRLDTKTEGAPGSRFDDFYTDERLTLRNLGAFVYDPRLLNFSLGGTFGLAQDWLVINGDQTSSDTTLIGYDALVNVLSEQPFSLSLFANRNQASLARELAGRSEILTENRGATIFARALYIPSTLTVRQVVQEEESRIENVVARRSDEQTIVRYEGQRGWVDNELGLLYEYVDDTDKVFPGLSFQSHEAQVNYGLDFGEELNRRWDSRVRYSSRTGLIESTYWSLDELLRIDHTERLQSSYRYSFLNTETPGGGTTTQTAVASLQHRLYESLRTTLTLDAVRQDLVDGEKDAYRGRLDFGYTKRLPLGGRLNVGVGGSLQYEDDRFKAAESLVSQETHTAASPFALPIDLDNPFVVTPSIVVVKTAFGPLPPGCFPPPGPPTPLVLGVDYTVRPAGDITEIVPIPCAGTTPGINPGDTIAVDYRFSVAPAITFTTAAWNGSVSVDYRWIRVFFSHEQYEQSLVSGRDSRFLDNQQSDGVGAELRYDGYRLRASLLGEARRLRSTRTRYDTLRASALTDVSLLAGLTLRLSADQVFTEFPDQNRETMSRAGRAALSYALGSRLLVDVSGGLRSLEDSQQPTEETTEARLLVRWFFRKVEVSPALEYFDRRRGGAESTEYRALVKTIRRF